MTAPTAVIEQPVEPRRRRRWPWIVLAIAVVLAAAGFAAEHLARAMVPDIVRAQLIEALDLPQSQELDVVVEGFHLGQLLRGQLDTVQLSTPQITFGPLTGAAEAVATEVPVRGGAIGSIRGSMEIRAEEFLALLKRTDLPLDEVTMDAGIVRLSGEVNVLGFGLPLAVSAEPSINDGDITLRPYAFELGSWNLDAQELIAQIGSVAGGLTDTFPICIADQVPRGVQLQGITVDDNVAVFRFEVDGEITVDEALQANGSCR